MRVRCVDGLNLFVFILPAFWVGAFVYVWMCMSVCACMCLDKKTQVVPFGNRASSLFWMGSVLQIVAEKTTIVQDNLYKIHVRWSVFDWMTLVLKSRLNIPLESIPKWNQPPPMCRSNLPTIQWISATIYGEQTRKFRLWVYVVCRYQSGNSFQRLPLLFRVMFTRDLKTSVI